MKFTFLEVKNSDMLKKVFEFRYKVMSEIKEFQEYFLATEFKNNQETDMYDKYSLHFVVLDESDNICANVRLIHNSELGYPTENQMLFNKDMFERDKLGELSRIFIDSAYRNLHTTKNIIHNLNKLLYAKMVELNIEYTYGALEPGFIRLLKMCNMPYEVIGEEQVQGKMGLRFPCILYTKKLGSNNQEFINS